MKKYIIIISSLILLFQIGLADVPNSKKNENNSLTQTTKTQSNAVIRDSNKVDKKPIKSSTSTSSKSEVKKGKVSPENSKQNAKKDAKANSTTKPIIADQDSTIKNDPNIALLNVEISSLNEKNKNLTIENQKLIKTQKGPFPDYIFYILSVLVLGLSLFIFFLYRMKNKKIDLVKNRKDYYKTLFKETEEDKIALSISNTNLSSEVYQLKKDKENLQSEIRERQQNIKIEVPLPQMQLPQFLYADAIINGQFNRVKEQPNEDTIFELKLNKQNDSKATIIIFSEAFRRVIANPAFLEGCEKQILGNSTVTMLNEGIAQKDSSGKWNITKSPIVKII